MQKKQVAVIDIGSSKITAVVAERGINKTFVIKGRFSYEYDGFADGAFFDTEKLKSILFALASSIKKTTDVDTVYVGVPGEFTQVFVRDSQISFAKKKKLQEEDVSALYDASFVLSSTKYTLISRSAIVYELDDFRRLAYPVGAVSSILKGKLSFVVCTNYFIEAVKPALDTAGFKNVEFVSSALAEALYLVEAETRDRIAIIADIGYISTTFSIVQGDGILYQKSFAYGGGYITASITERLDVEFKTAEKLKKQVNLCSVNDDGKYATIEADNGEYYRTEDVKDAVLASLDELCECIAEALYQSKYILPEYVSLMVTGGGISFLRGAKEHVSSRINMLVDIVAPKVPMMDKPTNSSTLSLLNMLLK